MIENGLLARPSYNGVEIDFLADVIKDGGVGIDIGCNIGLYSLPLGKSAGATGRVLAIDANPEMIRHLNFNATATGLDNVTRINIAVGDRAGRVTLNIRLEDVAIVSVFDHKSGAIQMQRLNQIVEEAGLTRVDALKIDIEGHEDLALVPYLQTAPEALLPKRIVIETMGKDQDYPGCTAEFERLGYKLLSRTRNNSLYERG